MFSWQLFICVPWQPVHSNSAISIATTMWATNCPFKSTKIKVSVNKMKKKINQWACYNRIWSWSPMPCEKHGPRASVFVYWVPRAMFFTRHGRPWSNPTLNCTWCLPSTLSTWARPCTWKYENTCTWLKYFQKQLDPNPDCSFHEHHSHSRKCQGVSEWLSLTAFLEQRTARSI